MPHFVSIIFGVLFALNNQRDANYEFKTEVIMLRASIVFFSIALIAILLGATGFAGVSMEIGKVLLGVFLVLAIISFIASMITGRTSTNILP